LINGRSRLQRVAKEGEDILRAHRRRSRSAGRTTELRGRLPLFRKHITRAATRFLPFRRVKDEGGPTDATVRRFERLANFSDELFRYVQFGGRPWSMMVSFKVPMESLLAGKTLEFSIRMGTRDAILMLHPCQGEASGLKEIALFLSYDDTAVWEKTVKLIVAFQLLENIDILDIFMSALQLLPPHATRKTLICGAPI
jgi:hypothetical protein